MPRAIADNTPLISPPIWAALSIPGVVKPITRLINIIGITWLLTVWPKYVRYLTPKYRIAPSKPNIAPLAPADITLSVNPMD